MTSSRGLLSREKTYLIIAIKERERMAKSYGMVEDSYYLLRDCGILGGILLRSPFKRQLEARDILADSLQLLDLWDLLCCSC